MEADQLINLLLNVFALFALFVGDSTLLNECNEHLLYTCVNDEIYPLNDGSL